MSSAERDDHHDEPPARQPIELAPHPGRRPAVAPQRPRVSSQSVRTAMQERRDRAQLPARRAA